MLGLTRGAKVAVACIPFLGMTGCRDGRGSDADAGGSEGTADGGEGHDDDADGDDGEPGACAPKPGRVGLQRLTRAEYNRTVRDLFGVTSAPADAFPADSVTEGFDNHADSLTISPQLASLLIDAGETVAAIAMLKRGDTIITCAPSEADCAAQTLRRLATRVYRRPPSDEELDALLVLTDLARDEGEDFEAAIEYTLGAMLVSPQFLYRSVPPPGAAPLAADDLAPLTDYALASRLSYFLWGSTPDDTLLAEAEAGALTAADGEGLRAQFDRMLADDKADALYEGFATQWLALGRLGSAWPDPGVYPEFDDALRDQMLAETRMFFMDLVRRDGSAVEIITGTDSFASAKLAEIYGISGPRGDTLEPVALDPTQRAGVLTMPAIVTMLSDPTEPNIVRRGVWLAESILCAAPPPPAAGVPPEPDPEPGESQRDRLRRHREDPNCASCHDLIDPLGFAYESYDALGYWRTVDGEGNAVDNLGTLPDGTSFNGVVELAAQLADDDAYGECLTRKLMTYALGRTVLPDDRCTVQTVAAAQVRADAPLSDLLWAVVTSDAFVSEQGGQEQ